MIEILNGFCFGLGAFLGMLAYGVIFKAREEKKAAADQPLMELRRRNDLTVEQNLYLERIAFAIEAMVK